MVANRHRLRQSSTEDTGTFVAQDPLPHLRYPDHAGDDDGNGESWGWYPRMDVFFFVENATYKWMKPYFWTPPWDFPVNIHLELSKNVYFLNFTSIMGILYALMIYIMI